MQQWTNNLRKYFCTYINEWVFKTSPCKMYISKNYYDFNMFLDLDYFKEIFTIRNIDLHVYKTYIPC